MKKIIIVGAGIAGLTAGIYALQSGFETEIYESHTIPGGASTSWRRKGYLFEGGMHWLTGSSPKAPLNKLWREVGALDDSVSVYNRDPFFSIEYQGRTAHLYRDIERLRLHLLELSPEDEREINRLCRDIRAFAKVSMPLTDIRGVKARKRNSMPLSMMLGMLPALPKLPFYQKKSVEEYSKRFQSPLLRQLLEAMTGPDFSAAAMAFTLATFVSGDGGYPEGGSLAMANRMAVNYKKLGGTIHYGKKVSRISVRDGIACGVIIDGNLISADGVIVTQDTLAAVDALFDPPIQEPWAKKMRETTKPMLNTFIGVGVEADLSDLPESVAFVPDGPISCGGEPLPFIGINHYAAYKGYAPDGCTAVTCILSGDTYDFWKQCRENGTYEDEKQKLAEAFIRLLSKKYPQTAGKISVWDVATPLTYERYLGSYKGSWMSVMEKGSKMESYPTKPESIKNLYFAGQRLMSPGGLPVAAETGRKAVQYLCKDTDTVFQGKLRTE